MGSNLSTAMKHLQGQNLEKGKCDRLIERSQEEISKNIAAANSRRQTFGILLIPDDEEMAPIAFASTMVELI